MLRKNTYTYATHDITLECDVYDSESYAPDSPVFLFFHSGGLVGGTRICIPPWLVQVCQQRQWTLVSPSYRLLPQAGGQGLLEDAPAAYGFTRSWNAAGKASCRRVIVGGASAGFFMACLIAHHFEPPHAALLCITGIPTFRHPFFNSATLLTPEPIQYGDMSGFISGPVEVRVTPERDRTAFNLKQLYPNGLKNAHYVAPPRPSLPAESQRWDRGALYDYYPHENAFLTLVDKVDPGFDWTKQDPQKLRAWPVTIFIQGDEDYDVSMDVTLEAVKSLGSENAKLYLAERQGHLFEATFIEDDTEGMNAVREAVAFLDKVLQD